MADHRKHAARQAVADLIKAAQNAVFAGASPPEEAKELRDDLDKARSRVMGFIHPPAVVIDAGVTLSYEAICRYGDGEKVAAITLAETVARHLTAPGFVHRIDGPDGATFSVKLRVTDVYQPEEKK